MLSLRSMITVAVTAVLSLGLAIGASPQARAKVGEAAAKARLAAEAALSWAQTRVDALEAGAWGGSESQAEASTGADSGLGGTIASDAQARIIGGAEIEAGAQTEMESGLDLGGFFDWILEVGLGLGVRSGADAQAGAGT